MVSFKKQLTGKNKQKPTDPIELYDTLDRAVDKGPLRPAQEAVLTEWSQQHSGTRDVIVKLHTGQGKTLIGLLMLQARLNAGKGPALYLCPDNFLIEQTCEQARQFGITTCTVDPDLPDEFLNGDTILVASVQKLFNGLTKFELHRQSVKVETLLMDDAHACSDRIREQLRIRIPRTEPAYDALKTLFGSEVEAQGIGTYADIINEKREALLPVPYWAWVEKEAEIAKVLSAHAAKQSIKFAWPLLRDILQHCQCILSGAAIDIEPYVAPLQPFGTYWKASHRIFMSATVTDDAFLVKGLQLKPETILNPLTYEKETWSGEKMILLPSLIHDSLSREFIVNGYAKPNAKRKHGYVGLAPSFARTKDWEKLGALVATKDSVADAVDALKGGEYEKTVVLVNRYDGIDLPDDACRILIFDSRPYSESLVDLYHESCRPDSEATLMRTIRTVEQGMGRSVRGEKDYCVIIAVGTDLTRLLRERASRRFLSSQMEAQIELGLKIAELTRQEIDEGKQPNEAFIELIRQCLGRDPDWKTFYVERMSEVRPRGANPKVLKIYSSELEAERQFIAGDYSGASETLQALINSGDAADDDRSWYLQEMARYQYRSNRTESGRLQKAAHKANHLLLRPRSGLTVAKLVVESKGRLERIAKWAGQFDSYSDLNVRVTDILDSLVFGVKADKFEGALDELSRALGFGGERPDKEWKEGPDNLWALDASRYILWECKSEVDVNRAEINKREAEQMNRHSAWFAKHYPDAEVKRIIVHPSNAVPSSAAFTSDVEAMRVAELDKFKKAVREFFKEFETQDLKDLSSTHIQKLINAHKLTAEDVSTQYTKRLKNLP